MTARAPRIPGTGGLPTANTSPCSASTTGPAKVPQNLLILDRTGTVLHTLAGGAGDFYPAWAVDGDQVAFVADSGYDHGRAYFDVDAADAGGHVHHLWRSANAQFCDAGEGALDPAAALAVREAPLDPSLRWSLTSGMAYYSSPCSPGLQVVSVRNGATKVLGAGQEWHSPALSRAGVLAVIGQPGGPNGAPAVELVRPATGAILASLGSGETPSWSADGKSLYYQVRTAQSTLAFGSGTTALTTTRYLASIYRAPADGSGHSVVVRVDAYYLAGLSQIPGNGGVAFSAVGNDTKRSTPLKMGESLDKAWREGQSAAGERRSSRRIGASDGRRARCRPAGCAARSRALKRHTVQSGRFQGQFVFLLSPPTLSLATGGRLEKRSCLDWARRRRGKLVERNSQATGFRLDGALNMRSGRLLKDGPGENRAELCGRVPHGLRSFVFSERPDREMGFS